MMSTNHLSCLARFISFAALLLVVVSGPRTQAVQTKNQQPSDQSAIPNYSISRDTTRVTEPLFTDGTVDFVTAINVRSAKGITHHNNAAAAILRIFPESPYWSGEAREAVLRQIDADLLPMQYPRMIGLQEFADQHQLQTEEFCQSVFHTHENAWSAKQHPNVAKWLEVNRESLDAIAKATTRPRFYVPLAISHAELHLPKLEFPYLSQLRDASRALNSRARLRIQNGNLDEAWHDILALRRLAKLVNSQPTLYQGQVGLGIAWRCNEIAREFIRRAHAVPNMAWQKKLENWKAGFQEIHLGRHIDAERLICLQFMTQIADHKISMHDSFKLRMSDVQHYDDVQRLMGELDEKHKRIKAESRVDWNEGLHAVNAHFDRLVDIAKSKDPAKRVVLIKNWREKTNELEQSLSDSNWKEIGPNQSPKVNARMICVFLLISGSPDASSYIESVYTEQTHAQIVALSLASLAFRETENRLPGSFDELARYFADSDIFVDAVSAKPLKFVRDESNYQIAFEHPKIESYKFAVKIPLTK